MEQAIRTLENSGVILTPTDTTFGLSCLAFDVHAIAKLNQIKSRPQEKNYILLVDNEARLQRYVDVPEIAWDLIDLSEKPMTIVYDKILDLPEHLISKNGTVAIRLCSYKPLQKLIQKFRQPLLSTSANTAGSPAPLTFDQIRPDIIDQVDYILPSTHNFSPEFKGSSIIQVSHDHRIKVLRE